MKKNTSHYKLHRFFKSKMYWKLKDGDAVSQCVYFWSTMLLTLQAVGLVLLSLAVIVFLLTPFYAIFAGLTGLHFLPSGFSEMGFVLLMTALPIVLLFGITDSLKGELKVWPKWLPVDVWTENWLKASKVAVKQPSKVVAKEPSLVLAYLKAKKDKVCPLIKLED